MPAQYVRKTGLYRIIEKIMLPENKNDFDLGYNVALADMKHAIQRMTPSQMRHNYDAEWLWDEKQLGWVCSRCGTINENLHRKKGTDITIWKGGKFCPECGATMTSNQRIAIKKIYTEDRFKDLR